MTPLDIACYVLGMTIAMGVIAFTLYQAYKTWNEPDEPPEQSQIDMTDYEAILG